MKEKGICRFFLNGYIEILSFKLVSISLISLAEEGDNFFCQLKHVIWAHIMTLGLFEYTSTRSLYTYPIL